MKVVILAGGLGTRLSEETVCKPKPMVEIGGKPILWHIMNIYAHFGFDDFLVAAGYKGEVIKSYFNNFRIQNSDWTVDLSTGEISILVPARVNWKVGVIDTGEHTMTGGRLLRLRQSIGNERFMLTYGDGVANVDIDALLDCHRRSGRIATVTAVHPPARFGNLVVTGNQVTDFEEKPQTNQDWINGGFFVFEPEVFDYLEDDTTVLERDPLKRLAQERQLSCYCHDGFWQPMDTLREKQRLESLWASANPPWKVWSDGESFQSQTIRKAA